MPPPYLSSKEIDKLMRVLPLYVYFPKTDWKDLERAEIDDEKGNKLLKQYSEIYSRDFLKMTQDDDKVWTVDGGTGCKSNPKDSFVVDFSSPTRMDDVELNTLMV